MARIPGGGRTDRESDLEAPGFRIGNVFVMAGVPSIMQAMLDNIAPGLETGARMMIETIEAEGLPRRASTPRAWPDRHRLPRRFDRLLPSFSTTASQPDRGPGQGPRRGRVASDAVRDLLGRLKGDRALLRAKTHLNKKSKSMSPTSPKAFPSPGTSSTATRARSPGGCRRRALRGDRLHHPRRPGAGRHRGARARHRLIETVCVASYHDYTNQGELRSSRTSPAIKAIGDGKGKGVLVIDDLTDTGKTAKIVRDMLPNAHFATVYAKPAGGRWSTPS